MLLKLTGDESMLAGMDPATLNWRVEETRPLNHPAQISALLRLLGFGRHSAGVLPVGVRVHQGISRDRPGYELNLTKSPLANGLQPNDYVYVRYDEHARDAYGQGVDVDYRPEEHQQQLPEQSAYADLKIPKRSAVAALSPAGGGDAGDSEPLKQQLNAKTKQFEMVGRRLQQVEGQNEDLRRQVLKLTEEVRARASRPDGAPRQQHNFSPVQRGGGGAGDVIGGPVGGFAPPPPGDDHGSQPDSVPSHSIGDDVDAGYGPSAKDLEIEQLRKQLKDTQARLFDVSSQLETVLAWKAQHVCSQGSGAVTTSDLRQDITNMKKTFQDVVRERQVAKEELHTRRRHLEQRFTQAAHTSQSLLHEQAATQQQLMPSPYYMNPYTAPSSAYQTATSEGTICRLKVQTESGKGTVVRRMYSAVAADGQHVLILSSLEGVVTDEIAAEDLVKAGVGAGRPELLFLATERHRWVLSLDPADRARWLDWLVEANPKLAGRPTIDHAAL